MSLEDKSTWIKTKTWVIPLMVSVVVDDPTQYDSQMKTMVDRLVNELRGVVRNFDKSGKQLTVRAGAPVMNVSNQEAQALLDMGFKNEVTEKEADKIHKEMADLKTMISALVKDKQDGHKES